MLFTSSVYMCTANCKSRHVLLMLLLRTAFRHICVFVAACGICDLVWMRIKTILRKFLSPNGN